MTAAELIERLRKLDPTTLVVINTYRAGVFPVKDTDWGIQLRGFDGEDYHCYVLEPTSWCE